MPEILVTECSDCPGLHSNSEFPETTCTIARRRLGGMGHYEGGPAPNWCPLRHPEPTVIRLRSR